MLADVPESVGDNTHARGLQGFFVPHSYFPELSPRVSVHIKYSQADRNMVPFSAPTPSTHRERRCGSTRMVTARSTPAIFRAPRAPCFGVTVAHYPPAGSSVCAGEESAETIVVIRGLQDLVILRVRRVPRQARRDQPIHVSFGSAKP